MEVLRTENISKAYKQGTISLQVLKNVNITIQKGEFVAILGRSGSGKSTLLNILSSLDIPSDGKVFIDGVDIFSLKEEKRTMLRREKVGFVFQAYELLPALNMIDNIRLPELNANMDYVEELLDTLEIQTFKKFYPDQLSGGQQQRAAIARALINQPPILFADEPTGNLDLKTERIVIDLLKNLVKKYKISVILVTHNETLVNDVDRVIYIKDGEVVDD